jgi:hypothetical protein
MSWVPHLSGSNNDNNVVESLKIFTKSLQEEGMYA